MVTNALQHELYRLLQTVPLAYIPQITQLLVAWDSAPDPRGQQQILAALPANDALHQAVARLLLGWWQDTTRCSGSRLSDLITTGAYIYAQERQHAQLDLVWTGPTSREAVRQTTQALLDVIHRAQATLLLMAFAIYDIDPILTELGHAVERGVSITWIIERYDRSQAQPHAYRLPASPVLQHPRCTLYEWPLNARPRTAADRYGVMHGKCAVADERIALISSANFTRYALHDNIEVGVLIDHPTLPARLSRHIQELIVLGVFQPIED